MKPQIFCSLILLSTLSLAQPRSNSAPQDAKVEKPVIAPTKPIALMGGKIETPSGIIESGVILIDGSTITYVGKGDNIRIGDVTKIDCTNKVIYAGFCDPYVTRGLSLPEAKENEIRDTNTNAPASMRAHHRKVVRPDVKSADFINMKGVTEPYQKSGYTTLALANSVGVLRGPSPVIHNLTGETKDILIKDIAFQVASIASGGGFGGYPGSTFASMAVFRQTMNDAATYPLNSDVGLKEINEALAPVLAGTVPLTFFADDNRTILRSLQLCQEYGVRPILAYAREAYRVLDQIKASKASLIVSPAIGKEPTELSYNYPINKVLMDEEKANWTTKAQNIIEVSKAGIPFAFTASASAMSEFYDGLRWLNAKGLDRKEILNGLTLYPAQILGISDKFGSLETGKTANITIMSGDFLAKSSVVTGIVVNGKYIEVKL